ncbi:GNAT family N-acetyltransferase [Shewanella colwelliana]|uniref:GNAT family N-acetyltransferase n=1 Tax=Shewanella colwelliana TaxID=23 RepID=UPI0004AFE01F|nr:GNAT family N-acetyltransferase [Shewanella colwelliana]
MILTWLDPNSRAEVYRFYRQFMPYARLTKKELVAVGYRLTTLRQPSVASDTITAAVRLRPIGPYQLLTGMLVHPDYRQQGLGHSLMQAIDKPLQTTPSFLFSLPELTHFYAQHGFVEHGVMPAEITQLYQGYINQGKQLVLMRYELQTLTKS